MVAASSESEPQPASARGRITASDRTSRIDCTIRRGDSIGSAVPTLITIGHGTRSAEELVATLAGAGARTLVDVRRYPGSHRNPQFNQQTLASELAGGGIRYVHAVALGGRRSGEAGEERFACIRTGAFRSYAARMMQRDWLEALTASLAEPGPCFMCAETDWRRCHRRLIADFLAARGHDVVHLLRPGETEPHTLSREAEARGGKLYLCGELVA